MEKNRFLTLAFGFIPGAGHMYLGLMKKGVLLMASFGLALSLADFLHLGFLSFIAPIIWFYCFFDTLTLSHFGPSERALDEEDFIDKTKQVLHYEWKDFFIKYRIPCGTVALILGIYALLSNFVAPFLHRLGSHYTSLTSIFFNIPTAILSIGFIIGGLYLLSRHHSEEKE
ncbi:MAG: hypothetical protein RR448_03740 [Niameybacter sp.]|uniref:hypothetical protein n=1 Tax=Niameybacter sp. TaxID=2033640 RepID=UPI002FC830BC